jgi:hypothetical protein
MGDLVQHKSNDDDIVLRKSLSVKQRNQPMEEHSPRSYRIMSVFVQSLRKGKSMSSGQQKSPPHLTVRWTCQRASNEYWAEMLAHIRA